MSKTLGVNTKIFINKDRFLSFVFSKKHSNVAKIAAEMGYGCAYIIQHINSGAFSIKMLFALKTKVRIEFKDMDFIDDPAYKIVAQLYGHPDEAGGTTFGKLVEEVREYFASGLDADKIRDILIEKKAKGKIVKASSSESLPITATTHSEISEAFDDVANSEQKTIGQVIIECAEEISANVDAPYADLYDDDGEETHDSDTDSIDEVIDDLQKTLKERSKWVDDQRKIIGDMANRLRAREMTSAQTLAKSIMVHIEQLSTLGSINEDAKFKRLRDSRAREARMKKEYWVWKTSQGICKDFNLHVKERPWLETLWFFITEAVLIKDQWPARGKIMINQIKLETFSGRYPIKKEEEPTND